MNGRRTALTLALLGLDEGEQSHFRRVWREARAPARSWRLLEGDGDTEPDAVVVDPMVSIAHPVVQRSLAVGRPLIVGYRRSGLQSSVNVLSIAAPVSAGDLETMLQLLESRLAGEGERRGGVRAAPTAIASLETGPLRAGLTAADGLPPIQSITAIELEGVGVFGLEIDGRTRLGVFLPERVWMTVESEPLRPDGVVELLRRAGPRWRWRRLDDEEWDRLEWGTTRLPIGALRWFAGASLPCDRLHGDLAGPKAFRLARWPDFGAVGSSPMAFRLASHLTRGARSFDELVDLAGGKRALVVGFLNACYASAQLICTSAKPGGVLYRVGSSVPAGVIARLRKALGIGS